MDVREDDDDAGSLHEGSQSAPSAPRDTEPVTFKKKGKKGKKSKGKRRDGHSSASTSLLSFGDDDDEDAGVDFALQRNLQRKKEKQREKAKQREKLLTSATSSANASTLSISANGSHTSLLQTSTPAKAPRVSKANPAVAAANHSHTDEDGTEVDRSYASSTPSTAARSYNLEALRQLRNKQSFVPARLPSSAEDGKGSGQVLDDPLLQKISHDVDSGDDDFERGNSSIPDEDQVMLAKHRRRVMREEQEYIELDKGNGDNDNAHQRQNGSDENGDVCVFIPARARLIREDADDADDADDILSSASRKAMSFGEAAALGDKNDLRRRMEKRFFEADTLSTDEQRRWESEKLRRAATTHVVAGVDDEGHMLQEAHMPHHRNSRSVLDASFASTGAHDKSELDMRKGYYLGKLDTIPASEDSANHQKTLETLHKKLKTVLEDIFDMRANKLQHKQRIEDDLANLQKELPQQREGLREAMGRYDFFKETKIYVRNLLTCIDTKVDAIEQLESDAHALFKECADQAKQSIQREINAVLSPAGTDLPDTMPALEARNSRLKRLGITGEASFVNYDEGDPYACYDASFSQRLLAIVAKANAVFDDANEEFYEIPQIAARFEKWKLEHSDSYKSAFIYLSFRKILKPLITLQSIKWTPLVLGQRQHGLENGTGDASFEVADFEQAPWFADLISYGSHGTSDSEEDPDSHLVPDLIDAILFPKLVGFVEHVYDPLSAAQTTAVVTNVVRFVEDFHIPLSSDHAKPLLPVVKGVFERAFDSLPPLHVVEDMGRLGQRDRHSQSFTFALLQRVCENLFQWRHIMSESDLMDVVFGRVIVKMLLPVLKASQDCATSTQWCEAVVNQFMPEEWFSVSGAALQAIRLATSPLAEYLSQFGRRIGQTKADRLRVVAILQRLNETKKAASLEQATISQ